MIPRARPRGRVPTDGVSAVGSGVRWQDRGRRIPKLLEWLARLPWPVGYHRARPLGLLGATSQRPIGGLVYEPYRVAWQQ